MSCLTLSLLPSDQDRILTLTSLLTSGVISRTQRISTVFSPFVVNMKRAEKLSYGQHGCPSQQHIVFGSRAGSLAHDKASGQSRRIGNLLPKDWKCVS